MTTYNYYDTADEWDGEIEPDRNITDDAVSPGEAWTTLVQVAAAASEILNRADLHTVTMRATLELAGSLRETVLGELRDMMTTIGHTRGWPEAAELLTAPWLSMEVALTAEGPDGTSRISLAITSEGVVGYSDHDEIPVTCPAELLAVLA